MPKPGYSREAPASRRRTLIEATARAVARHGAGGVSVRLIAAEAGVSPGLVTHHFEGVEPLLAATYRFLSAEVGQALAAHVNAAGADPKARLLAYVGGNFAPPVMDADLLATWLGLLSLAKSVPLISAAHAETYAAYRMDVGRLLAACRPDGDTRLDAVAVIALIDGLWLELCLGEEVFTAQEAKGIAERWIEALLQ